MNLLFSTLWAVAAAAIVAADTSVADRDMDMDGPKEFHPVNAMSKSFHWILTVLVLLVLPSVASALAWAQRLHWSLVLQVVATAYSVLESLFLDFPDNTDNHENRTSKGTSWFLSILLGVTIFVGSLVNGANLVMNKWYPQVAAAKQAHGGRMVVAYQWLSFVAVLTGWVRACMAPVALFGFCYGHHTGQCIAHGIMGSSFVAYGFVLAMVLVVPWFRNRTGRPQEFWDSSVMCLWGIVNTFTEHRWGKEPWNMGDYDHTAMGLIWACGGLLGMWLSRKDQRTFVPALLLIFTGWSMSQHVQKLAISTKVHAMFGMVLMAAGVTRIIEVAFVLKGSPAAAKIASFQHLPPFCLTAAGVLFMAANEEQLILVHDLGAPHAAYVLTVLAAAFTIYLWMLLALQFFLRLVGYDEDGEVAPPEFSRLEEARQFELDDLSEPEP